MKILYHKDDDGRCAAAIIHREFNNIFDPMSKDDFVGYFHGDKLVTPELKPNEPVFIVDIALDSTIENFITTCLNNGAKVVHIDHHKTGIEYWMKLPEESILRTSDKYRRFFKVGTSGTLLSWIYTYMTEEEREHATEVPIEFAQEFTHVAINFNEENPSLMREYHIPHAVRYIEDYDLWTFLLRETKYFHAGLESVKDKHPLSDIWNKLVYDNDPRAVAEIISAGRHIEGYKENLYKRFMNSAYEFTYNDGLKLLCVNSPIHGSAMFGDKVDSYDAVCVYHYDGNHWHYSMYSKEDGADVSKLVQEIASRNHAVSAGGHEHAAGMVLYELIFE